MIDWKALKKEVDDEHGELDECGCPECIKLIEEAVSGNWHCEMCGYDGEPFAFACACYDTMCNPTAAGSGCFHGQLGCPLCDDGERLDVVTRALVRALRRAPEPLSRRLLDEAAKAAVESGTPIFVTRQARPRLQASHAKPATPDPETLEAHAQRYEAGGLPLFAKAVRMLKPDQPEPETEPDKPWRDPCPKCKTPANPRAYSCKNCDHSWLPVATQEHDILQGFYKVAIAERDHERRLALKAEEEVKSWKRVVSTVDSALREAFPHMRCSGDRHAYAEEQARLVKAEVKALRKEAEALAAESEKARSMESEELQLLREEVAAARIERDDARRFAVHLYDEFPDPTYENSTLDRWKKELPAHKCITCLGDHPPGHCPEEGP